MVKAGALQVLTSSIGSSLLSLALCLALLSGCETLKPVEPTGSTSQPGTKAAGTEQATQPQPSGAAPRVHKSSPKGLSKTMDRGGRQPVVQKPDTKPSAPPPPPPAPGPTGVQAVTIPPEPDTALAANINEILEKNPIDEKADQLLTSLGKIASGRVQLLQTNGDIKPHYHVYHDEIVYIVKGKGILTIDEDRHVASPGTVFIIPKRATYGLQNTGEKPLVALVIEIPPADPKDVWTIKAN